MIQSVHPGITTIPCEAESGSTTKYIEYKLI